MSFLSRFSSLSVIDSFEDGNISEYGGDTNSGFAVVTSPVFDGSNSLKKNFDDGRIAATGGRFTVTQGTKLTARVYLDQGSGSANSIGSDAQPTFEFAAQSETGIGNRSGYAVLINAENEIRLDRFDNSSKTVLAANSVVPPEEEWLKVTVDWKSGGTISFTVDDAAGNLVSSGTATDTTYTSGGIGFSNTDGLCYFDFVVDRGSP